MTVNIACVLLLLAAQGLPVSSGPQAQPPPQSPPAESVESTRVRTIAIDERLAGEAGLSIGDLVTVTTVAGTPGDTVRIAAITRRGADPKEIVADLKEFGDLGRGGVRLQAALCALELLMPVEDSP